MSDVDELNIVLGYGCHLNAIVREYLEHAALKIKLQSPMTNLVITTGGRTAHRSAPGISEAALMADHLRTLGVTAPILTEETARTTVENIRNVARMIEERKLMPRNVLIFGDSARRQKIAALARHFFGARTFRVEAHDLRRSLWHAFVQSTVAVPFDALCARVAWLERLSLIVVERRIRRS